MRVVARFATWHIPLIVLSAENNSVVEKNRKLKLLKMNKKRKRKRRLFTGVRKLQETVLYHVEKKPNLWPRLWMGFNCCKATATSRRQFTFYL